VALTLAFDETPERTVPKAAIHELRVAPVDPIAVIGLADRLGLGDRIEGLSWELDRNWLSAGDGTVTISLNERSGGLRYRLRPLSDEPGTSVSTSPAELERLARGVLDRLGRPAEPAHLERITYLRAQSAATDGATLPAITLDAGLLFTRTVDDLPVVGAGGTAMVKIGTDERHVGGREVWRPIGQRGSPVPLRSADEAVDMLQSRLRQSGMDGEARVRKARLGYAELGIEDEQRFLEPCYAFLIEAVGGLFETKTVEVVPAARVGPMAMRGAVA